MPSRFRLALAAALLLPLAGAGCVSTQTPDTDTPATPPMPSVEAEAPFRLALGDAAEHDGHVLRFVEVVEDSRCPVDVTCVRAGKARVRVEVDGEPFVLSIPHTEPMRDGERTMVEHDGVQVSATGLEPVPGSGVGGRPEAVLVVSPANG